MCQQCFLQAWKFLTNESFVTTRQGNFWPVQIIKANVSPNSVSSQNYAKNHLCFQKNHDGIFLDFTSILSLGKIKKKSTINRCTCLATRYEARRQRRSDPAISTLREPTTTSPEVPGGGGRGGNVQIESTPFEARPGLFKPRFKTPVSGNCNIFAKTPDTRFVLLVAD